MKRARTRARAGVFAALLGLCGGALAACGDKLPKNGRLLADADGWQLAFAPIPGPLVAGKPFSLDLVVCAQAAAKPLTRLGVDADMPAHKHGMNYRAVVKPMGDSRYRAEGLLFHMPGRWRFLFELELAPGQVLRLTREVEVS